MTPEQLADALNALPSKRLRQGSNEKETHSPSDLQQVLEQIDQNSAGAGRKLGVRAATVRSGGAVV